LPLAKGGFLLLRRLLGVLTENKGGLCSTLFDGNTMIIKTEKIQYERLNFIRLKVRGPGPSIFLCWFIVIVISNLILFKRL
jgi:hypothetical protein